MPTASSRAPFEQVVNRLERFYGKPRPPAITSPFGLILYENVAYLVSDEQRDAAFNALRDRIGIGPVEILTASEDALYEVAKLGGMNPEGRVKRLRLIAQLSLQEFEGDLESVLKEPFQRAKKFLMLFPSIGEPGAEKVLLFSRSYPVLALDSNGLRALVRIGFGWEAKSYSTTYRSVREALKEQINEDYDFLIRSHQLLRRHGQALCRRTGPDCKSCPLTHLCKFYKETPQNSAFRTRL